MQTAATAEKCAMNLTLRATWREALRPAWSRLFISKRRHKVHEHGVLRPPLALVVELLEALARQQRAGRSIQHDVLRHEGPPLDRRRYIEADVLRGRGVVAQHAEHRGVDEAKVRQVADHAKLRRDIDIDSSSDEQEARVHEIRLSLVLRRSQAREHRVASRERYPATAHEGHRLPDPEARVRAGELRVLEDRVETRRLPVEGVAVSRLEE